MSVPSAMVGDHLDPVRHDVDARWTMAYAAALDDHLERYFDTTAEDSVVAHPVFSVCPEWPVIVASRQLSVERGVPAEDVIRSVHATHDVTVHRLMRPGDELYTGLEIAGIEQRRPGAYATTRLETRDAAGELVATTEQGGLYLGVDLDGPDRPVESAAPPLDLDGPGAPTLEIPVPIVAGAAHTYTECARIWNPIHTDATVAIGAGLPGIILHGTATLAHGVSQVVRHVAGGDPTTVRRVVGRFGAMVFMPSTITVRIFEGRRGDDGTTVVPFEVRTEEGGPAVDRAAVVLG